MIQTFSLGLIEVCTIPQTMAQAGVQPIPAWRSLMSLPLLTTVQTFLPGPIAAFFVCAVQYHKLGG
jgi:hypothetical protein